jgi:hypothetical protein
MNLTPFLDLKQLKNGIDQMGQRQISFQTEIYSATYSQFLFRTHSDPYLLENHV